MIDRKPIYSVDYMALFGNGASNERGNLTMGHAVILCKSETNPTVYFDPKVDYIGSINNCAITIPNLANRNRKDFMVEVNGKDNAIDLQIPAYNPNENHCTKFRIALRVYPSNSVDTFMDTCIDFKIGFSKHCGMVLASLGEYKYTKKGFGDDGIAFNSRDTLVTTIQNLFYCNQMWLDLTSIKCGDYYVESRKDNWLFSAGLKAKLIIYRKTK